MTNHRYRAFISYSHADERWGDWLHRALETYRVPEALIGQHTAGGPVPRRLTPIFRDRADLPAAGNLNAEIQTAIGQSEFQVIICSPNAAKSRWVNEEIKLFKKLHGPDRTLAVIVAGEPGASAIAGRESEECFPPALRFRVDQTGAITDEPAEPIAADARRDGDGRRQAITRLVAGLIGVKLDDLVQREAIRRARLGRAVTGGAMAITLVMGVLTVIAINARNDAHRMRVEAENLVEFMLTGLRDELETVGRLDALEAAGERALEYYAAQDEKKLGAESLGRRSRALLLVGEIDQRSNDLDSALAAFEGAAETTGELLRREPNNAQRIFDHAQSVFYVGAVALARNDMAAAEAQLREYLRLAENLVAIDPDDAKWRLELAYATNNLGGLKFREGAYDEAVPYFEQSVAARRALFEAAPADSAVAFAYAYALSWQAYAELTRGDYPRAATLLEEQLGVYEETAAFDAENFQYLDALVTAQRRLAQARLGLGDIDSAKAAVADASRTVDRLVRREPNNANWKINASYIEQTISYLAGFEGDSAGEAGAADQAVDFAREINRRDASDVDAQNALAYALARRLRAGGDALKRAEAAGELARLLDGVLTAAGDRPPELIGDAWLALAEYETSLGDTAKGEANAAEGVSALATQSAGLTLVSRIVLARLYLEAGDAVAARKISDELPDSARTHPEFQRFNRRLQLVASQ